MRRILFLSFVWAFTLFFLVGILYATNNIPVVADLDSLSELVDASWTNNLFSKIVPPGDMEYNNDIGVVGFAIGFDTNFINALLSVTNDSGNGTNFVLYPVKVIETTNGNDRVRHYFSAISTNPVAIHTTDVSIVNYPEDWIEETYGEPPSWLTGQDLQDWYDDRDPMRQNLFCDMIDTNNIPVYEAWLTNTVNDYAGTNTNSTLSIYSNSIVFFETDADGGSIEFYLHAPTNVPTVDLFKNITNHLHSVGWYLSSSLEHNSDPLIVSDNITTAAPVFFCAGNAAYDSDGDGLANTRELRIYGTSTNIADSDGDGLSDGAEIMTYSLDALNEDSDGDGLNDGWEVEYGTDPTLDIVSGMVARWKFEEKSGSNAVDIINGNNGTYHGTDASAGIRGPIFRAMHFAGTNDLDGELDYLTVPSSDSLNISNSITLAAWIYPVESNDVRQAIFQKNYSYYLNLYQGMLQFSLYGVSNNHYYASDTVLATNLWSHLTATYNGSNVAIYINGILEETALASGNIMTNDNTLGIGYGYWDGRYFKGGIDDARIYSTALSSNQVYGLYEQGSDYDNDGLTLIEEALIFHTDPNISNETGNISGIVSYTGSSTGKVVVIASYLRHGMSTAISTGLNNPGSFTITNIPATNYWIKAFRDLNEDGKWQGNEPPNFTFTNVNLTASGVNNVDVHIERTRGMRVDFGEYYNTNNPASPWYYISTGDAVTTIVDDAVAWGVNTLYTKPLSTVYGTFWNNPTNQYLVQEGGHGANNILGSLITYAHEKDLKVIAWMQPVNAFTNAWIQNPDWRYRRLNGDYAPYHLYELSPFNTNVLNWIDSVVNEVIDQGVDGIDIAETAYAVYDDNPTNAYTYDTAATNMYFERYPGGTLGDDNWFKLREEVLTSNIYARLGKIIHNHGVEYHVTHTWDAYDDTGELVSSDYYAKQTGISFDDIMDIEDYARPDIVVAEFIWQEEAAGWPASYPDIFNPEWTIYAATSYVDFVKGRVLPSIHPEITKKIWGTNNIPSLSQFEDTMYYSVTNTIGCDFYIHHLAVENGYLTNETSVSYGWTAVSNAYWNRGTP